MKDRYSFKRKWFNYENIYKIRRIPFRVLLVGWKNMKILLKLLY